MESIIEVFQPSFERYGYLIVFAMGILENAAFVGAVVPGDVVLLLAGFYVQRSGLDLAPVVILAFVGALIGDTIGYTIGRLGGRRIVERFGGGRILPHDRLERVDRYFKEYGMWAVALGRLAPRRPDGQHLRRRYGAHAVRTVHRRRDDRSVDLGGRRSRARLLLLGLARGGEVRARLGRRVRVRRVRRRAVLHVPAVLAPTGRRGAAPAQPIT